MPNGHLLPQLPQLERETILWVGRSARFKRPSLFIDLAEIMSDEKLTMICQQATGDKKYEELVARAKQVKNLEFIERVPFGEIDSYFQRAKVFVNTSDSEGFPNTFIQACKCATPILSLNVNPDGFLDKYDCGISCDGDWNKFVGSLKIMLAAKRYEELGKNARKYVEEHHDITKIVQQYKKIFVEL
jgi:glycosyltransferase involved in cell wall biosynthesis